MSDRILWEEVYGGNSVGEGERGNVTIVPPNAAVCCKSAIIVRGSMFEYRNVCKFPPIVRFYYACKG